MNVGLVTAVIAAFLVGGFAATTALSYGAAQTTNSNFESELQSVATPLCGGNEVTFSGTAHFLFHETIDANGQIRQSTHMNYMKAGGSDLFGNKYQIHETDHFTVHDNEDKDLIHTVINGKLVGKGINTGVIINLLTKIDENVPKTIVENIKTQCNGEG